MANCPEGFVEDPNTGVCVPVKSTTPLAVAGGGFAGGIDPDFKAPADEKFRDPTKPYAFTNDDWQILNTLSKDKVIAVQSQLQAAFSGFKPGTLGNRFDSNTVKYFKLALGRINALNVDPNSPLRGKNVDEALAYLTTIPQLDGAGTSLPSYRLTNPEDLKTVFTKAAQSVVGRTLPEQDLMKLVNTYQGLEKTYQQQASAGGTVTQAPDAGVFAQEQVRKAAPVEAEATDYVSYISSLSDLMQG
jgi:hypothetical protein